MRRRTLLRAGAAGLAATATLGTATAQTGSGPSRPFQVTNQGLNYFVDGVDGPTLDLVRGRTYVFEVSTPSHPFYVSTDPNGGTGFPGVYDDGVSVTNSSGNPNATRTGTLTFTVPASAPDTLYYQCGIHANMGGEIAVSNPTARSFAVTNQGLNYFVDGVDGPTLRLARGRTYVFDVSTPGHPFHVSTDPNGGTGFPGIYTDGVSVTNSSGNPNATESGTLTFAVPSSAPDALYYQCGVHSNMGGGIEVVDGPAGVRGGFPPTDADGDGLYEDVNGNGRRDYDDVVSLFEGFGDASVRRDAAAFDFNGNGRLDFGDVVTLFRR